MSIDIIPRRFGVTRSRTPNRAHPSEGIMSERHGLMKETGGEYGRK